MDISVIVSVVGGLISVLLVINAFFIKDLVKSINEMKLELVRIATEYNGTVDDVKDNKNRILELEKENTKARERLHSLESAQIQLMSYIEKEGL